MRKCLNYLSITAVENITAVCGVAIVLTLGCILTGAPVGKESMFTTYFSLFPFMYLLILLTVSISCCTTSLQLALSFGARRQDFFCALQIYVTFYALLGWVLNSILKAVSMNWIPNESTPTMDLLFHTSFPFYILIAIPTILLGCALGPIYTRSPLLGSLVMVGIMLGGISATVFLLLVSHNDSIHLWGDLPAILVTLFMIIGAVCEVFIYRFVKQATVR